MGVSEGRSEQERGATNLANELPNGGDTSENRRAKGADVTGAVTNARIGERFHGTVANANLREESANAWGCEIAEQRTPRYKALISNVNSKMWARGR